LPDDSPPELEESYKALLAPLLLNSALAAVRVQPRSASDALIAVTNATRALNNLDLNNADKAKALYRRALARVVLQDEDQAEMDLKDASQLVPEDTAISSELTKIRQHRKDKRDKEKKAYKKMFE